MLIPENGARWATEGGKSLGGRSETQQGAGAWRVNLPTRANLATDAISIVWPCDSCWSSASQVWIQEVWGGVQESTFLTNSQVMLMLLIRGPHIGVELGWSINSNHLQLWWILRLDCPSLEMVAVGSICTRCLYVHSSFCPAISHLSQDNMKTEAIFLLEPQTSSFAYSRTAWV